MDLYIDIYICVFNLYLDSTMTLCKIPSCLVSAEEGDFEIQVVKPEEGKKEKEFAIEFIIRNVCAEMLQFEVEVSPSESFFLAGEMDIVLSVPPFREEVLSYMLVPLEIGKLNLPVFQIKKTSMIPHQKDSEVNQSYAYTIFIFPN